MMLQEQINSIASVSVLAGLLIEIAVGYPVLMLLHKKRLVQILKWYGPQNHLSTKKNTPTMGGLSFLIFACIILAAAMIFWGYSDTGLRGIYIISVAISMAFVGAIDDYLKEFTQSSEGLSTMSKLFAQITVALICVFFMDRAWIPRWGGVMVWTGFTIYLGGLYKLFCVFLIVSTVNAVNITDGLDGLATGTSAITFAGFSLLSIAVGSYGDAIFSSLLCGMACGFLWFNANPAKMFMGDVGSHFLGGAIATFAILSHNEMPLLFLGGIFVIEVISVIMQLLSLNIRKKRIFLMSPIHHHFELLGIPETTIVSRLWIGQAALVAIGSFIALVR